MKTGILIAVILHVAFLLFGGLIFNAHKQDKPRIVEVTLDENQDVHNAEKDQKTEEPKPEEEEAKIEPSREAPPDATSILSEMERVSGPPALVALDLSQITAALNGSAGADGFGQQEASFGSGGVIGGTGKVGTLSAQEETTFSVSEIDQKPRAVFQANPVFPAEMRGKNVDGAVVVIFIVGDDGRVGSPRAESSNNAAFEKPALDAVRQWKFEPGMRAGQHVATRMKVTIRFQRS
jgi:periplasmic protein TonB